MGKIIVACKAVVSLLGMTFLQGWNPSAYATAYPVERRSQQSLAHASPDKPMPPPLADSFLKLKIKVVGCFSIGAGRSPVPQVPALARGQGTSDLEVHLPARLFGHTVEGQTKESQEDAENAAGQ
jgi:hypothetical protein